MSSAALRLRTGTVGSGVRVVLLRGFTAALGVLTVVLFSRLLAPDALGTYLFYISLAQFLALPLQMGIPTLVSREIAIAVSQEDHARLRGILLWSQRVILSGSALVCGVIVAGFAAARQLGVEVAQEVPWGAGLTLALLVPMLSQMQRIMGVLTGFRKPAQGLVPDGLVRPLLLFVLGGLGVSVFNFDEYDLLATYLVAAAAATGVGGLLVRNVQRGAPDVQPEILGRAWFRSLLPLTLLVVSDTVKMHTDVLMLGTMKDAQSVAFYRVATQLATTAMLIQVAVHMLLGPRIAASHARGDRAQIQRDAVIGSRIVFSMTFLFALCVTAVGEGGIVLLLGEGYASVYPLAVFLAFGLSFSTLLGGSVLALNMTRNEASSMTFALWTTAGNVVLNILFIPIWGGFGAALSTIGTSLALRFLSWNKLRRDLGLRTDGLARARAS